jgi:hypothetical protein
MHVNEIGDNKPKASSPILSNLSEHIFQLSIISDFQHNIILSPLRSSVKGYFHKDSYFIDSQDFFLNC